MPKNVLVLVCDTARADAFEPYGAPAGSTPAVTRLAEQGAAIENVFSTACWTLPSHASMFSGLLPRALGLGQAPGGTPHGARPVLEGLRERLLPEVLSQAGWDTRGVSTNLWVSPYSGLSTGFDEFELIHAGTRQEQVSREDVRGRAVWAYEGLRARADDGAGAAERTIRRWLGEPREKPFFWFVNLVECHSPYLPPRPYNDLGPLERMRAAEEARRHLSLEAIWRTCLGDFDVGHAALARMRHLYARSVRLMDDWLDRVLSAMDEHGVLDDTLVIVTSDHGENFGEGGLLAHAFSVDDRLIRVPFVVSRPGFAAGDGALSLADLPRLLADHLGIAGHPWDEPAAAGGLAAAQFDFIEADDPRLQIVLDSWDLGEKAYSMMTTPLTCVTDGSTKLLRRGEREEIYDLASDPLEEHPGSVAGHPDQAGLRRLREALAAADVQRVTTAPPAPAPHPDAEDLESRMRLLGYM